MKQRLTFLVDMFTKSVMRTRTVHAILLFIFAALTGLILHGDRIHYALKSAPIYEQISELPHYVVYFAMIILGTTIVVLSWLSAVNVVNTGRDDNIAHVKSIMLLLSISFIVYSALYFVVPTISHVISEVVLFVSLFLFLLGTKKFSAVRAAGTVLMWHIFVLLYGAIFSMFVVLPIMKLALLG